MSAPTLREAALALAEASLAPLAEPRGSTVCDLCGCINTHLDDCPAGRVFVALDAPPPDVPEVRRVIGLVLDRHQKFLAATTAQNMRIQRGELDRLIEELVSLWERA